MGKEKHLSSYLKSHARSEARDGRSSKHPNALKPPSEKGKIRAAKATKLQASLEVVLVSVARDARGLRLAWAGRFLVTSSVSGGLVQDYG